MPYTVSYRTCPSYASACFLPPRPQAWGRGVRSAPPPSHSTRRNRAGGVAGRVRGVSGHGGGDLLPFSSRSRGVRGGNDYLTFRPGSLSRYYLRARWGGASIFIGLPRCDRRRRALPNYKGCDPALSHPCHHLRLVGPTQGPTPAFVSLGAEMRNRAPPLDSRVASPRPGGGVKDGP